MTRTETRPCAGPRHTTHADAMHAARALTARGTPADRLRTIRCGTHGHVAGAQ